MKKIISILAETSTAIVRWLRTPDNLTKPAWKNHLDRLSQRQLADLVIPPEKLDTE